MLFLGLVGNDALVEVKCLHSASKLRAKSIEEVLEKNKRTCLQKTDKIALKRQHSYYYQVQGQMNITKRNKCYFIVYVADDIELFVEEISRDEEFWKEKMLPVLIQFYMQCIAPEIVRGNISKHKRCVDPPYITDAIKQREEDKENKHQRKK